MGESEEWVEADDEEVTLEDKEIEIEDEIMEDRDGVKAGSFGKSLDALGIEQDVEEWKTFRHFPGPTQGAYQSAIARMKDAGRTELTILLLGKSGVGKSSAINQIIGERKQKVNPFGVSTMDKPAITSRVLDDFTITLIDTPSLLLGDRIHESAFALLAEIANDRLIDVVYYVDRLDTYDISSLDKQIFASISRVLGMEIWLNTMFVLTHGEYRTKKNEDYSDYVSGRVEGLRKAVKKVSKLSEDQPLAAIIESSSKCARNWSTEKILPDQTTIIPNLISKTVDVALNNLPFEYTTKGKNPNNKNKWLVPIVLIVQLLLKQYAFDTVVKSWDTAQGDEWGPKNSEFKDEKYINKMKEAKKEYIRRQKAKAVNS